MKIATLILLTCVAGLLATGFVMLFSASTGETKLNYWLMQPVWGALGIVGLWTLAWAGDYTWLKKVWWLVLAATLVLLILVLVPGIGKVANGARRWFAFGGLRVQPTELAKMGVIIVLAWYGERHARSMRSLLWGWLVPGSMLGAVVVLVFLEPDWGTAALIGAVGVILLYLAGARIVPLTLSVIGAASAMAVLLAHDPVRLKRWLAFLHLERYRDTFGFQTYQSVTAIGSGGWLGKGLCDGRQKFGFVPELHTDFIFSLIGEELGHVGAMAVLLAFLAILFSGLHIARHARDAFGRLLASGITFLIAMQAAINIGVVTSALPNKGLGLPFISYGGSNLVILLAGVGLLWNVARHGTQTDNVFRAGVVALPNAELEPA
ncbi:MAG: cell division protein FtsW [Verrucomicrobia bacterium]|nr:cell division protein FtsW [Verrucomicrobiota bacterium]